MGERGHTYVLLGHCLVPVAWAVGGAGHDAQLLLHPDHLLTEALDLLRHKAGEDVS